MDMKTIEIILICLIIGIALIFAIKSMIEAFTHDKITFINVSVLTIISFALYYAINYKFKCKIDADGTVTYIVGLLTVISASIIGIMLFKEQKRINDETIRIKTEEAKAIFTAEVFNDDNNILNTMSPTSGITFNIKNYSDNIARYVKIEKVNYNNEDITSKILKYNFNNSVILGNGFQKFKAGNVDGLQEQIKKLFLIKISYVDLLGDRHFLQGEGEIIKCNTNDGLMFNNIIYLEEINM